MLSTNIPGLQICHHNTETKIIRKTNAHSFRLISAFTNSLTPIPRNHPHLRTRGTELRIGRAPISWRRYRGQKTPIVDRESSLRGRGGGGGRQRSKGVMKNVSRKCVQCVITPNASSPSAILPKVSFLFSLLFPLQPILLHFSFLLSHLLCPRVHGLPAVL